MIFENNDLIEVKTDEMVKAMHFMNYISERYGVKYDEENKYYSIISGIKEKYENKKDFSMDEEDRKIFEKYIMSLEIPNLRQNINSFFGDSVLGNEHTLNELSDSDILCYLSDIFKTVTFTQKDNLVLGKYGIAVWNTGFHKLAKSCRGKIVDMNTMNIVSHPFDKFFNLNEVPETNPELIKKELDMSNYITVLEKIDGSTIVVSNYNGKPLITTNGSFENDQITWAEEILKDKYNDFLENIEPGYTFIFELVHPENKIVINYGDTKDLYLLAIRNLAADKLVPYANVAAYAEKFNIPTPKIYDFKNLDEIVELAHTLKNANQEGWVFRIGGYSLNEKMFKLKLDEYFEMHKCYGKITTPWVYKHLCILNDIDDFLAISSAEQKEEIYKEIDLVNQIKNNIKTTAEQKAEKILEENKITREELLADPKLLGSVMKKLFSERDLLTPYVAFALKTPEKLDSNINFMSMGRFKNFMEKFKEEQEKGRDR